MLLSIGCFLLSGLLFLNKGELFGCSTSDSLRSITTLSVESPVAGRPLVCRSVLRDTERLVLDILFDISFSGVLRIVVATCPAAVSIVYFDFDNIPDILDCGDKVEVVLKVGVQSAVVVQEFSL